MRGEKFQDLAFAGYFSTLIFRPYPFCFILKSNTLWDRLLLFWNQNIN